MLSLLYRLVEERKWHVSTCDKIGGCAQFLRYVLVMARAVRHIVRLSSVTFVHPAHRVENFGNIFSQSNSSGA